MLHYIYGHDEVVAHAVAQLIPHARGRGFENYTAIGIADADGKFIAGIVYHQYDSVAQTIEITGAALPRSGWLTRETLAIMYQYPFLQLKCQMVIQRTPADNKRLLRQLAVGNFSFILVPRMFGRDRDGVLCCLTYEAWAANKFCRRYPHNMRGIRDIKEAA
jgi:hypothetical protein